MTDVLLDPKLLVPVEGDDENDVLYGPAARISPVGMEEPDPAVDALEEAAAFAKKFDEKKHPRWPKGTPRAGQFMRKGDWFHADGKVWQIVSTAGGRVEAVEASGKAQAVEHRVFETDFDAVDGPGVAVPGVEEAKPQKFDRNTSPVVVPYVDPASHDPSIKRPANATVSEEEWKRFGKDDQAYYVELMERFGEWKPSAAKSTMAAVYSSYSSKVQQVVKKAYQSNKGGSGFWNAGAGQWLNLAWLLKNVSANPKTAWDAYKEAKVAFDEVSEVVHWDLFNRTRAPDIALFHGGARSVNEVHNEHIAGDKPIYAGYSQSYSLSGGETWGSTVLMTPTAIKHIAMSYYTPLPGGNAHWEEKEIAVGVRMLLDERSVVFNSSSYGVTDPTAKQAISKWLHGQTGNNPAGGQMVEELKKTWSGEGGIPIPPPGFDKVPIATGAKQYEELPDDVAKAALEAAKTAKYKSEDGTKEGAVGKIDGMGLKPGDLIEGQKGARYVIIEDAGDDSNGLRYVSVLRSNGAENFPIDYGKSFPFGASAGNDFYRLDAHVEIPKKKKVGFVPFSAEQYDQLVPGAKTKLGDMALGDMFKEQGEGFKIAGAGPSGTVLIESLETGKQFKANRLFKAVPLVPKEGFVPPTSMDEEEPYEPQEGELVRTALGLGYYAGEASPGTHWVAMKMHGSKPVVVDSVQPFEKPAPGTVEPGDIFSHNGLKYTVTSVLKDGTVRAKPPGGKVEKFPKSEVGAGDVFRPGDWEIGAKQKAKTLSPGDLISASSAKVRPYLVMGVVGKTAHLLNLETGEQSKVSSNKSYNVLAKAELKAEPEVPDPEPKKPETMLPPLEPDGTKAVLNSLAEGTTFLFGSKQYVVTVEADEEGIGKGKEILADGTYGPEMPWGSGGTQEVLLLYPKPQQTSDFDQSKYAEGPATKLKDAEAGTVFLSATGIPMQLKSTTPKGGATAVALHNGKLVKNISYEKDFTTLVPKVDEPFDYDQLAKGDVVPLEKLKDGDWFKDGGDAYQAMVVTGEMVQAKKLVAPNTLADKNVYFGPGAEVEFHAHAADGPKISDEPKPQADPPDADALPLAPEYTTYLHPKSGKKKYPKLGDMQPGTFFKDKAGKKWLVKANEGGQWVAITDGQENFKAAAIMRGSVSEDALFHDSSPPLGGSSPLTASYEAELGLKPNPGASISELGLEVGDQFTTQAGVWSVQVVNPDGWVAAGHVGTGETKMFGPLVVPDAYSKAKSGSLVGKPVTSTKMLERLPVGSTVKHSSHEHLVYEKKPNGNWQPQTNPSSEFASSAFPTSAPDVYEVASVPETAEPELPDWMFDPDGIQVGDTVTLKPGTLYKQPTPEDFTVVDLPESGAITLDNGQGGTVDVQPGQISGVKAAPPGPMLTLGTGMPYGKDDWLAVATNLDSDALNKALASLSDDDLAVAASWADEAGANNLTIAIAVEQVKRAPKPRPGLSTTAEALEAGFYEEAGPKVAASELPNMALARTPGGKVVYKYEGQAGGQKAAWYALGGDKKVQVKATTKLTPLKVTHADPHEYADAGEAVLGELGVGEAFAKATGGVMTTYLVIGRGDDGMHFMNTDTGVVLFGSWAKVDGVKVMRREGPGAPIPESSVPKPAELTPTPDQKEFFAQLGNGDKAIYTAGWGGEAVEIPVTVMDNQIPGTGVMVADKKGAQIVAHEGELIPPPTEPRVSDYYSMVGNLPLGSAIKTGDGVIVLSSFKDGEAVFIDTEGETVTLGQAAEPPAHWRLLDAPVGQKAVTHTSELEVGDTYTVADHGLTWQVVGKTEGGGAKIKLIGKPDSEQGFEIGYESELGGPEGGSINVVATPGQLPEEDLAPLDEEPPLGEGESELSPVMEPNEAGVKLKDLPAGAVYAYKDEESGLYDVKKIVKPGADPEVDAGGGVLHSPSGVYAPEFIWLPRGTGPGEPPEPPVPALPDLRPVSAFEHGSHAWSLGGKHGIVKVSPTSLEKGFYMDEGGPPISDTELYVADPMGGPTPELPTGDPDLWAAGDIIASGADKAQVVAPLNTGGYVQLMHLEGDEAGEEFSLHKSALVQTYGYKKVPGATAPAADSETAATFGALEYGKRFTTEFSGAWEHGQDKGFHPSHVWMMVSKGSVAGWAKREGDGALMKFPLGHPVREWKPTPDVTAGDPLKPYLHPKSGTYKYDQIGTLAPGTQFTDKSKNTYVVIGQVGDQTLFENVEGEQFSTAKKNRVKVTQAAEGVQEARLAFSSGGAVRIAA